MDELLHSMMQSAVDDADLQAGDIPRIELYMDQILTLFDEGLAANRRHPEDRALTKTMINNYSKERLIMPVKGKKYSREQVMQLLCILMLKQLLPLADIKTLMTHQEEEINFEAAYKQALQLKERLRGQLPLLIEEVAESIPQKEGRERELVIALMLASGANYMRRACEKMIDRHGTGDGVYGREMDL